MSNFSILKKLEQNVQNVHEAYHLHACRQGPINANEVYLSLSEATHRPFIKKIKGVIQPKGVAAKFLWYWTSGLSSELTDYLTDNLILSGEKIRVNNSFNQNILCTPSDELSLLKDNFLESVVIPLIDYYKTSIAECDLPPLITDVFVNALENHNSLNLQDALSDISLIIANTFLGSRNLPIYSIEHLTEEYISKSKSIDSILFDQSYSNLIRKRIGRYGSACGTIRTELRSYNGKNPSAEHVQRILSRSKHKNPALAGLNITEEVIREMIFKPDWIPPVSSKEIFELVISAYSNSITQYSKGKISYLDGKEVVDAVFKLAEHKNMPIILQEFNREDNYDIYKKNISKHPNLTVLAPVCNTWDVKKFPEFDQNIFTALRYFAHR